jgi:aminoglycoside phosphotransferase (APT) family kinase protein
MGHILTAFTVTVNTVFMMTPTRSQAETTNSLLAAIRTAADNTDLNWAAPPQPLTGGFWAQMWKINLTGDAALTGDLVARVMPDPAIAARETAVQTYLASAGYPTPTVHISAPPGPDLDQAWMLMDHAPGAPLLTGLSGPTAIARLPRFARTLPDQLARHAATLHRMDPSPIAEQLHPDHTDGDDIDDLLRRVHDQAATIDRADLTRATDHLNQHRPPTDVSVICHGDLHPFNILTHGDGDTVLDWSASLVADPAYDIAFTRLLLANPPLTAPAPLRHAINLAGRALAHRFATTYTRAAQAGLDPDQLHWYGQLHALRILTEVATWHAHDELANHPNHPFLNLVPAATRLLAHDTAIDTSAP